MEKYLTYTLPGPHDVRLQSLPGFEISPLGSAYDVMHLLRCRCDKQDACVHKHDDAVIPCIGMPRFQFEGKPFPLLLSSQGTSLPPHICQETRKSGQYYVARRRSIRVHFSSSKHKLEKVPSPDRRASSFLLRDLTLLPSFDAIPQVFLDSCNGVRLEGRVLENRLHPCKLWICGRHQRVSVKMLVILCVQQILTSLSVKIDELTSAGATSFLALLERMVEKAAPLDLSLEPRSL